MNLRAAFLWLMIGSLALAAALGVFAIIFEGLGDRTWEILGSALLAGGYCTVALLCAIVQEKHRLIGLMWAGIACGAGALLVWLALIWLVPWVWYGDYGAVDSISTVGGTLTTVSLWAAHHGLMSLPRLEQPPYRAARLTTQGLAGLLGFVIIAVMWTETYEDWTGKLIGVLAILAACGTVVTPVLAFIERRARRGEPETVARRVEVELLCPRCGTSQRLRAGPSRCSACNLRITLDVEEPRCACGYLLYKLESDRCPECGKAVPDDQRWAGARS